MAGDSSNASLWANADVYFDAVGATFPTDVETPWGPTFKLVGLLDGDEGFTESRDEETDDKYAWGGLLVRTVRSKHKRTLRFVALEDNPNVFDLVNPGSTLTTDTETDLTTKVVKVPVAIPRAFGFETREGFKVKRRMVDRAEVTEVAEIKESETELTVYDITVTIYPDSDGVLYREVIGTVTP